MEKSRAQGNLATGVGAGVNQVGTEEKEKREVRDSDHAGPADLCEDFYSGWGSCSWVLSRSRSLNAMKGRKWVSAGETVTAHCVGRKGSSKGMDDI